MPVNDCTFETRLHFLPTDCRKSRNNSFSIFNRLISAACTSTIFSEVGFFRGRPCLLGRIPAVNRRSFLLCRLTQFLICFFSSPRLSAISLRVFPAVCIACISFSSSAIFVYFLDITKPPCVVLLSYTGRLFVYCLLFTDQFSVTSKTDFFYRLRLPTAGSLCHSGGAIIQTVRSRTPARSRSPIPGTALHPSRRLQCPPPTPPHRKSASGWRG